MKQIIRLTESELRTIIENTAKQLVKERIKRGLVKEDVLGDNWHETDDETPFNNYEPFESQMEDEHNWSGQGEENIDPTFYDDPDAYRDDVIGWSNDPSDNDLYNGRA